MGWARIDDGFHDHPKVDEISLAAIGLWTLCLTWANRHRKKAIIPGHIPAARCEKVAGRQAGKLADELVRVGLWEIEPNLGGWVIHDFRDYLPKERDPVERAEAGRRGARSRWNGKLPSDSHGVPSPELSGDVGSDSSRASARAFPTRPDPVEINSGELRTETLGDQWSSQPLEDPSKARCTEHRGWANPPPCSGCKAAREHAQRLVDRRESELQHEKAMRQTDAVRAELAEAKATATKPPTDLLAELKASLPTVRTASVAESLDDQALAVAKAKEA